MTKHYIHLSNKMYYGFLSRPLHINQRVSSFQLFLLHLQKDQDNIPTTGSISRASSARLGAKGLRNKLYAAKC